MIRSTKCFTFLLLAVATVSARAEHIVDAHIAAMGGAKAIAKIKTIERSGKLSMSGAFGKFAGTIEEAYVVGKSGYSSVNVQVFVETRGWEGEKGWKNSAQTGVSDMSAEELQLAKISESPSVLVAIKNQFGLAAFEEGGDKKFNDKDCAVVNIVQSPLIVYVNKETKLIEGFEIKDMMTVTTEDYKAIDGVQFPHKSTSEITVANVQMSSEVDKTVVNGEIDSKKFSKPNN